MQELKNIKLKEFLNTEHELDCDICPYRIVFDCNGGVNCYGGEPVYPPCSEGFFDNYDENKTLDEIVNCLEIQRTRQFIIEEQRIKEEREREEKEKIKAEKAQATKWFCEHWNKQIRQKEKVINSIKSEISIAKSYAEAVNFANSVFRSTNSPCPKDININTEYMKEQEDIINKLQQEILQLKEEKKTALKNRGK